MTPRVVNVSVKYLRPRGYRDFSEWAAVPGHHYVGRRQHYVKAPSSGWENPYRIGLHGTREQVISKYRGWIERQIREGRLDIADLADATELGCWCAPEECHADVIAEMIDEFNQSRSDRDD